MQPTLAIIPVLISICILQGVSLLYVSRRRKINPDDQKDFANIVQVKRLAQLESDIDVLSRKHDQMRLTVADAVDKVERFARRWIKRDWDEKKIQMDGSSTPGGDGGTREQRLAAIRARRRQIGQS